MTLIFSGFHLNCDIELEVQPYGLHILVVVFSSKVDKKTRVAYTEKTLCIM